MKLSAYQDGFTILNKVEAGGLRSYPVGSGVAIAVGDAIIITSGYAALATTLATPYFVGIAASTNTAAEASSNGAVDVLVIPPLPQYQFAVPATANALLTQANVGVNYNVDGSEDGITVASALTNLWAFFVDDIDVSTAAVAVNTYGYAIGHFHMLSTT